MMLTIWNKLKYLLNQISIKISSLFQMPQTHSNKHKNAFIETLTERWHSFGAILAGFLILYYGIGIAVSSKINNTLDTELKTETNAPRYITAALSHVLKTQVDDSPWTPALPAIFPAAILDNLPNFQIGSKDAIKYLTRRLSAFYASNKLKEAEELLSYPPNIWLFSQTNKDKLAPGSAKQYRKALAKITSFSTAPDAKFVPSTTEYIYILKSLEILLQKQISGLTKHAQEHQSELIDFKADDIFYRAQGNSYVAYYTLTALLKDYQDVIVQTEQYERVTSALKFLKDAVELNPLSVKNAALEDTYAANHLLYLAYYLSQASNKIMQIRYNTLLKAKEQTYVN